MHSFEKVLAAALWLSVASLVIAYNNLTTKRASSSSSTSPIATGGLFPLTTIDSSEAGGSSSAFSLKRDANEGCDDKQTSLEQEYSLSPDLLQCFREMTSSFEQSVFKPDSWLEANCHYQTIIGTGALQSKIWGEMKRPFKVQLQSIATPDGDFFDIGKEK